MGSLKIILVTDFKLITEDKKVEMAKINKWIQSDSRNKMS